ncbi:MAG: hypothetical protein LBW85_01245 [Deltaproteobacteria bacterium]|jgi:hypothetical protein|nr:hypothetical protein [Deltaproteobacteria bacterium]
MRLFRVLGTLFVSGRGTSLGRVMMLVMFGFCLWQWATGRPTQDHAFQFLVIMTGYVFGSKLVARVGKGRLTMEKDRDVG